MVRESLAVVNADFQESLSGIREAQAFVHEVPHRRPLPRGSAGATSTARLMAQRTIATYFPFVLFLSAIADVIVLGVGAHLIEQGRLTTGVLIAFILYLTMFFSPIQQLSQVFDSWQQTRVSVNRISELMRLETLTPEPERAGRRSATSAASWRCVDVHFRYPSGRGRDVRRARAGRLGAARGRRTPPAAGGAARARPARSAPARPSPSSARPAPASRRCSS